MKYLPQKQVKLDFLTKIKKQKEEELRKAKEATEKKKEENDAQSVASTPSNIGSTGGEKGVEKSSKFCIRCGEDFKENELVLKCKACSVHVCVNCNIQDVKKKYDFCSKDCEEKYASEQE